jgi:stage III sporulation protein AC
MDVELILKVAGVGMIVAVVCQILSRVGRDDQSSMVSLAGVVVVLLLLAERIGALITMLRGAFGI